MSIDKSFEKCLKSKISEEAYNFMNNYEGVTRVSALGYFEGFTDGQKTLSPEVREGIQRMIDALEGTSFDDTYEAARVGKKILEKME